MSSAVQRRQALRPLREGAARWRRDGEVHARRRRDAGDARRHHRHALPRAPDGSGESDGNPDECASIATRCSKATQNLVNCLLGLTIQRPLPRPQVRADHAGRIHGLQAILYPVYNSERWTPPNQRVIPIGTAAEVAAWKKSNDLITRQVNAANAGLATFAEPLREQLLGERLKDLDVKARDAVIEAFKAPKDKQTAEQQALLKTHAKAVKISDDELAKRFPEFAALRDRVKLTIAEREKDRPKPLDQIAAYVETDPNPAVHHLLRRGQHNLRGKEVQPTVPASLCSTSNTYRVEAKPMGQVSSGRRTALANWVTSPENPLFARVMVNRIWQLHFGTGLVATSTPRHLGPSPRIRAARLPCLRDHAFRLEREGPASAHPGVGRLSAVSCTASRPGSD